MKVTQIATILNEAQQEIIGESAVTTEDLTNVVDMGKQILEATDVDNYVRKLIDKVGRMIFVDRVYNSTAPDILTDSWEYVPELCRRNSYSEVAASSPINPGLSTKTSE